MNENYPKRITYVDDDQHVRQIFREVFEREEEAENVVVATCGSGEELLARFPILQPELLVLDLRMPSMTGPDIIEKLHEDEETRGIPIIFATGVTKVGMKEAYEHLGVIGVIHKPFDLDTLPQHIGEIWASKDLEASETGHVLEEHMEGVEDFDTFKEDN